MTVQIKFFPLQIEAQSVRGANLLTLATDLGIPVDSSCGGKGACGKCKMRVLSGKIGAPTENEKRLLAPEEAKEGWVLACQKEIDDDLLVEVPVVGDEIARKAGLCRDLTGIILEPAVYKQVVTMTPPSITDQRADAERLLESLPQVDQIETGILRDLPETLRRAGFLITAAVADKKIIAVEEGDTRHRLFGLYFDIGTTTILGVLVDLRFGQTIASRAVSNPQSVFGADVISRITFSIMNEDGLKKLHERLLASLNGLIDALIHAANIKRDDIYDSTIVGNTTMSHLFLGVPPVYLASSPFISVHSAAVSLVGKESGLSINPLGRVYVLPNIAGYVGSDTVGVMLATDIDRQEGFSLAIDIGTNGEVILAGHGRILTCSTAAGPAFEGAHIQCGMRAMEGAIESVVFTDGKMTIGVIGSGKPMGICGSGLIDGAAVLLQAGVLNSKGKICSEHPDFPQKIGQGAKGNYFLLIPGSESGTGHDIVITQKDIRELQLAKGAICAGIITLISDMGISNDDISRVLLAGAFGNYIGIESALRIGLLPGISADRIIQVGNAAGDGAKKALLSKTERHRASRLARIAEHVEISNRGDFLEEFIRQCNFPQV